MEELAESAPTPRTADFINASFALPFCHPSQAFHCYGNGSATLKPGAIFAGQLLAIGTSGRMYAPEATSPGQRPRTFFLGFELVHFEEVEKDGDDAMGGLKHHHVFPCGGEEARLMN